MPKSISVVILNQLLEIVQKFPNGASVEDILQYLDLPKRSLQRYLKILVKEGRLIISGSHRSTRYHLIVYKEMQESVSSKNVIPLSKQALSIQALITQPIQARRPVGYNRDFLNHYRPNETHYLSVSTRKHLLDIGKSPDGIRPVGTYARELFNRLLIDLSWNSSRLEGNTYSLLETQRLLELGQMAEGKNSKETQMILNHKAAIEFLIDAAEHVKFNKFTILNLHALLSDNLLDDEQACGNLRSIAVGIGHSTYLPLVIPQLIDEYFTQILDTVSAIQDPFEQAFFIMVHIPYLQPFLDVNKRVSRLAANIPFIRENLCPLSFVDVPEDLYINGLLGVYELNRIELLKDVFIWAYERSSARYSVARQYLGEPDLFRLRHRELIIDTIGDIVRQCMDKQKAVAAIKQKAIDSLSKEDHAKFLQVIEQTLISLHLGNIARFRLNPSEYNLWIKSWH